MTPRTPGGRAGARALLVGTAAALTLGLSACSALADPGAAAIVGDRVVPQSDVQTVVAELPAEITGGAQVDPSQVLGLFVVEDVVTDVAREFTTVSTPDEARVFLQGVDTDAGRAPGQYSEPTLRVIATQLTFGNVSETDQARPVLQEQLAALVADDLRINPRYGRISDVGELQLGVFQHDWLPEPAPQGEPPVEGAAPVEPDADS